MVPHPFTVSVSDTASSSVPSPHRPGSSVRKSNPASVASYSDEEELDMDGQVRGEIGRVSIGQGPANASLLSFEALKLRQVVSRRGDSRASVQQ